MQTDTVSRHVVAVVGGATAGAEVAARLAERGAHVVVFEQNPRPYGKIEDGLPRWHVGLRQKEFLAIAQRLGMERVHLVPLTRVGRDVAFPELARSWGFSAIVLANGAWRDRPLPIPGADKYVATCRTMSHRVCRALARCPLIPPSSRYRSIRTGSANPASPTPCSASASPARASGVTTAARSSGAAR